MKKNKYRDMTLRPSHDEIVGTALRLLKQARERGIRTSEADHPFTGACQQRMCVESHLLGYGGKAEFLQDDWLEGQQFQVFGEWNIHGAKYDRIYAWFPAVYNGGKSVDVTAEVLK